jgi:hypothetical protein
LPALPYGHDVSLRADPDHDAGSLLCAPDGHVLARLTLRDDDGEQVAARVKPVMLIRFAPLDPGSQALSPFRR